LLESLHFTIDGFLDEEEEEEEEDDDVPLIKPGNWKLMKLKDLVYRCRHPDKGSFVFNIFILLNMTDAYLLQK